MNNLDSDYQDLLAECKRFGRKKTDRTGTGTRSITGWQIRHYMQKGFPLLTTKKIHWNSVVHELLWFISGSTNVKYLQDNNVTIWNEWADDDGELGPVYGHFWKPQLGHIQEQLRKNPNSRRHLVVSWNSALIREQALPPCHYSFQFVTQGRQLDLVFTMRSTDVFLGLPFNLASYGLLLELMAATLHLEPGTLIYHGADVHLYETHTEQALEQMQRIPRHLPTVKINRKDNIFDYTIDDIELIGYDPHPGIKAQVAV